jgi:hypothetical protein
MKVNEEKHKENEQTKLTFCDKSKSIPFGKIQFFVIFFHDNVTAIHKPTK